MNKNKWIMCITMIGVTFTAQGVVIDSVKYNYKDVRENNVLYYRGQIQGRDDHIIMDAIKNNEYCKVYSRKKTTEGFTYIGMTNHYEIVQHRTVPKGVKANEQQILIVKMTIDDVVEERLPNPTTSGVGKYKRVVMQHLGIRVYNVMKGIYRV